MKITKPKSALGLAISQDRTASNHMGERARKSSSERSRKRAETASHAGEPEQSLSPARTVAGQLIRKNRRSGRTVDHILRTTWDLIKRHGAQKLSMLMVSEAAGVSRGTLYRYFPSKAELLQEVAHYLRAYSDREVIRATEPHRDPKQRFDSFVNFICSSAEISEAGRLLEAEPGFLLNYLRESYDHLTNRTVTALDPVFDLWEEMLDGPVERSLVADLFVRVVLSELILMSGGLDREYWQRVVAMVQLLRGTARPAADDMAAKG